MSVCFCYFIIISPWKGVPFICTNLNSLHTRLLCAKFGWNWSSYSGEEDLSNFVNVFSLFVLSSLEKGSGHSFEQTWIPFIQGWFVLSLVEIGPVVLKKKIKNVKTLRTDSRTTGNQKSSLELSAQVGSKLRNCSFQ